MNTLAFRMRAGNPAAYPGYWAYFRRDGRGPMTAIVSCPICGVTATLERHQVGMHGDVAPTVRCGRQECGWEANLILLGWDPFRRS